MPDFSVKLSKNYRSTWTCSLFPSYWPNFRDHAALNVFLSHRFAGRTNAHPYITFT